MIRYIIIDDEPIAHRIIESYTKDLAGLEKAGNSYSAVEALSIVQKGQVDLIFLDINMPKLSGFDMLKTLSTKPAVIVTSAYKEFALEGYELDILDYLLKPFSFERFLKAVNKVLSQEAIPVVLDNQDNQSNKSLFLKEDRKLRQVYLNDISYIEAYGNYCKVHLKEEVFITPEKISDLEEILPPKSFLRVHKSFIVALNEIKAIEGNKINIHEQFIPVGQTYTSAIKKLLNR